MKGLRQSLVLGLKAMRLHLGDSQLEGLLQAPTRNSNSCHQGAVAPTEESWTLGQVEGRGTSEGEVKRF